MMMEGFADATVPSGLNVNQVLLVAADINDAALENPSAGQNEGTGAKISASATRVTVYYSRFDTDLIASDLLYRCYHNPSYPGRLGLTGPISYPALAMAAFADTSLESVIGEAAELLPELPVTGSFPRRFEVLRQIGQGGMGMVFEAIDKQRNLQVALKCLSNVSPLRLYSFKQEFRSFAGLTHPNLVKLYELIHEGDEYFLSMEFINGTGFLEYVWEPGSGSELKDRTTAIGSSGIESGAAAAETRRPACDPDRLRAALRQVAAGLTFIHKTGKLRRDLKPSNLMVSNDGRAIILDFGLVAEVEREQFGLRTEAIMGGTKAYMSPEQAEGLLAPSSDWYSSGVVLFEALTGKLPSGNRLSRDGGS